MTADTLERRLTSLEHAVGELGTRLREVERRVTPATEETTRPDEQPKAVLHAEAPKSTPTEASLPESTPRARTMPPPLPGAGDAAGAERGSRWASVVTGWGEMHAPTEPGADAPPLGSGAELPPAQDRVDDSGRSEQMPVAATSQGTTPSALAYEPAAPAVAASSVARREAGTLERSLGGKWAAWLGALVMVVGAGLGLKFAYDQGWLGGLPAWVRLTLWAAASLAMVGAGEVVLRRIGRAASAGVFAAGLGSLFAVAYSGHAYFNLYSPAAAFALTILAALLGAGVAARARLLSIGVLTLLGGHLAPLVIGGDVKSLTPFLAYLVALQVVGLAMAGLGGGRWWALRWLSLAAAGAWALTAAQASDGVPVELMVFALVTAGLAMAELVVSAIRRTIGTASEGDGSAGPGQMEVYLTAAGLLGAGLAYAHAPFGWTPFLVGAMAAAAGLAMASRAMAGLAARRGGDAVLTRLDAMMRAQALSVAALGLFHGLPTPWHLASGAAAGVLLGVFTRLRTAGPGRHFSGIAAVLLPVGAAARYAIGVWGLAELPQGFVGLEPALTGLAYAGAAWAALLLAGRREDNLAPPVILSTLPALAFVPLAFAVSTPAVGVAITLGLAWAWAVVARVGGAARYLPGAHAGGVLGLSGLLWALFVAVGPRLSADYSGAAELLLFNPTAITGLLLAASVVLIPRLVPDKPSDDGGAPSSRLTLSAAAVGLIVVLAVGLLEVDRAVLRAGGLVWGLEPMLARAAMSVAWFSACVMAWGLIARRNAQALHTSAVLAVMGAVAATLTLMASLGARGVTPVGNAVVVLALVSLASAGLYGRLLRQRPGAGAPAAVLAGGVLVLAGGAVELFRYAAQQSPAAVAGFPAGWAAVLLLTPWAAAVGVGGLWAARKWARDLPMYPALTTAATALLLLTACKALLLDAVLPWVAGLARYGTPLANLQLAACVSALAGLLACAWLRHTDGRGLPRSTRVAGIVISAALAFLASNAEAARCLTALGRAMGVADVRLFVLAGYSVWWALLALGAVIAGFRWRLAGLRYAGLSLFALTLLKVVTLDLAGAGQGWRVLSFIGLGAVLLATSVLYAKLAPLLLPREESEATR